MATIESLEIQMSSVIRAGLREAMQSVDIADLQDPLHEVIRVLESCLYDSLYAQILETYSEGYEDGGYLIWQAGVKVDMVMLGDTIASEDPIIAKIALVEIQGLERMLEEHTDVILETIQAELKTGVTMPQIATRLEKYFDEDPVAASRFARTAVTDIYNSARLAKYEDSGVVDGAEFSAHIDDLTSDTCRMFDGTIWKLGDSEIRRPPLHFNCRSNILPFFGEIPGKRDFVGEYGSEFVEQTTETADTFLGKYWASVSDAMNSVEIDALRKELGTVKELIADRCRAKPPRALTVDEVYAKVGT